MIGIVNINLRTIFFLYFRKNKTIINVSTIRSVIGKKIFAMCNAVLGVLNEMSPIF